MDALNADPIAGVAQAETRSFERALEALRGLQTSQAEDQILATVLRALSTINASEHLGISERSRRARVLLAALRIPASGLVSLSKAARDWKSEVKNAVSSFLPPGLRREVYSANPSLPALSIKLSDPSALSVAVEPELGIDTPGLPRTIGALLPEAQVASDVPRFRSVLLLGTQQEHETNQLLLQRNGFDAYRVDHPDRLAEFFDRTVCGVVVGRSWWTMVPPDKHCSALEQLFGHSTFTWVRLDETGFFPAGRDSVQNIHRRIRLSPAFQVTVAKDCRLTDYDRQNFDEASCLIATSLTARLTLGQVHANEEILLLAATAKCVRARHLLNGCHLEKVPVAPLSGGQSSARIFRVDPDDRGAPLIAKLDNIDSLKDEMERFELFIRPWDSNLHPCLHFHSGVGAIIFALIEQPGSPGNPAPTLEDRVKAAMLAELGPDTSAGPHEQDLVVALERSVDMLARLNARPCPSCAPASRQWLDLSGLESMLSRGIKLEFGQDTLGLRQRALEQVDRLRSTALVHGDVHLRNVLLRDDREPHFIDYALSGPGHPCFDLVRLESALFFQCFRMTDGEDSVAKLVGMLAEGGATERDISLKFPALVSCLANRLAIRTSLACRKACLRLLEQYGGALADYLAVKYVVACQSFTMPHLQTGVTRAALIALRDLLGRELTPRRRYFC